jgi:glycosyltransferase involved in cell wall biosynthesis
MKKVLFIASHRKNRAPGQRFRFEQYFEFLSNNNFLCELSYIISNYDDKVLYVKGKYLQKIIIIIMCFWKRYKEKFKVKSYDIIFIFREALMTRSIYFEKKYRKTNAKIIFDFDDSIWLPNVSDANKKFSWLKNPSKTAKIIELSDMVFAGNQYLADYAFQFNKNIKIIPTTIDTDEYQPLGQKGKNGIICIGWSGSITTIKHFEYAVPFLLKLKKKYKEKICFKVIGDATYKNDELCIKGISWEKEEEIKELSTIDIGIMPLPDDDWARGKCGLKGLQYMSLEIPTVISPVGVNTEIIQDGVNGFLASTEEEWVNKISLLIDSPLLREQLGNNGRKTVLEKYSFHSYKQRYLDYFEEVLKK